MNNLTSSKVSIGILLGLAAIGLGMQACGGDSTSSTSTTSTTSTTGGSGGDTSSTSSTTSSAGGASGTSTTVGVGGAGGATSSSSASTGTGGPGCAEITVADLKLLHADGSSAMYSSTATPNLGDATVDDKLFLEFYGSGIGPTYDGEKKGTFDLGAAADSNYGTCSRCLSVYQDASGAVKYFFQKSGSLAIDATSDQLNGTVKATITDLTLIEVTLDSMGSSTPVTGGACRHLATATVLVKP